MMDTHGPFVSVVLVTYNYAHFLPRCLDALRGQTFQDFEVVLVNNGSTDNTQEFVEQYIKDHPEMVINLCVVEKNIGLPNGRNIGLEHAQGEYVMFHDADDWAKPDCLASLVKTARETNADRVVGDFDEVDAAGNLLRICRVEEGQSKWLLTSLQSVLFRRSILEKYSIRIPLDTKVDDLYMNVMFSAYTDATARTGQSDYFYYINQYSTSGAKSNNKTWNGNTLVKDCLETMEEVVPLLKTEADYQSFMYVMQKQFYFFFLHNNRYTTFKMALKNYHACRKMLLDRYPDYLKNPMLKLLQLNGDRRSGQKTMWLLSWIERLHLFWAVILGLVLVSKHTYISPR